MKKCYETRRNNTNAQMLITFEQVLKKCKKNGYRPDLNSDLGHVFDNLVRCLGQRNFKGISSPDKMFELVNEIRKYPTYKHEEKRLKKISVQQRQENAKAQFDKNYADKKAYFPKLDLIQKIYGDKTFEHFIAQKNNVIATKFLAKYMDIAINNIISCEKQTRNIQRNHQMLNKHLGVGVTDKDLEIINEFYDTNSWNLAPYHRSSERYKPSKNGLHTQDVGILFDVCKMRVQQVINKIILCLRANNDLRKAVEFYIAGKWDEMFAKFPQNWYKDVNYQKKYNMTEIPYEDIEKTGRWLTEHFILYQINKIR